MSQDTTGPRLAALATALGEALVARDEAWIERDAYCASLREAKAELAEARAELASLRADSPAAKAAASMSPPSRFNYTDAALVERAVWAVREPGHVKWWAVGSVFGLGSPSSHALCLAVGVDPDERTPEEPALSECPTCGADLGGEE